MSMIARSRLFPLLAFLVVLTTARALVTPFAGEDLAAARYDQPPTTPPELSVHMNGRIYDPLLGRFLSADKAQTDSSNGSFFRNHVS
jgi:hypothetical protein